MEDFRITTVVVFHHPSSRSAGFASNFLLRSFELCFRLVRGYPYINISVEIGFFQYNWKINNDFSDISHFKNNDSLEKRGMQCHKEI